MRLHNASITLALSALATLAACSSTSPSSNGAGPLPSMQRAGEVTRAPMVRRPPSSQTLYISDLVASSVTLFPANVPSPSPIAKITDGIDTPDSLVTGNAGKRQAWKQAKDGDGVAVANPTDLDANANPSCFRRDQWTLRGRELPPLRNLHDPIGRHRRWSPWLTRLAATH